MIEPTFEELVKNFNIISKSLSCDEFNYPQLKITMRTNWEDRASDFCADLNYVEVKERSILKSVYGVGLTPEDAMRDYYKKIIGKRLVYRATNKEYRRECVVVG